MSLTDAQVYADYDVLVRRYLADKYPALAAADYPGVYSLQQVVGSNPVLVWTSLSITKPSLDDLRGYDPVALRNAGRKLAVRGSIVNSSPELQALYWIVNRLRLRSGVTDPVWQAWWVDAFQQVGSRALPPLGAFPDQA